MDERGLRYNIVTGSFTLPTAFVLALAMWLVGSAQAADSALWWGGFGATTLTAYMILELNNRNSLLRVRSRLVSSTFLVFMGAMTFMQQASWECVPPMCLLPAYYMLFQSYQNFNSQGYVFHAFLFVGIGALVFPKIVLLAPFLLFAMTVQLRCMTARAFFAALIGVSLPIVLREVYVLYIGAPTKIDTFWEELTTFPLPDYTILNEHQVVSAAFVLIIAGIAAIHFFRTKFNDKIRTRMFFYVIMLEEFAIAALLVAQPQHFGMTFRLLLANSCIIIAHQLAFARGIAADIYFYAVYLLVAFLAFYNFSGLTFGIWQI